MKDSIEKIKSWWLKVSTKKPVYEKKGMSPMRDWKIIFITAQIVVVIGAVGSFIFYRLVDSGEYFAVSEEVMQNEVKINIALLQKTVDDIKAREKSMEDSKRGTGIPADPSR